jgi:hypothetical protein
MDIVFTADTYVVPVGGTDTFHFTSGATTGCWIEPFIGNVPCAGTKIWVFPNAGIYAFVFHLPDGRTSQTLQIQVK